MGSIEERAAKIAAEREQERKRQEYERKRLEEEGCALVREFVAFAKVHGVRPFGLWEPGSGEEDKFLCDVWVISGYEPGYYDSLEYPGEAVSESGEVYAYRLARSSVDRERRLYLYEHRHWSPHPSIGPTLDSIAANILEGHFPGP
jgi:hypothetical protein